MPIDRLVMAIYGPFALEVRQTVARSALGKSTILLVQTATYSYRKKSPMQLKSLQGTAVRAWAESFGSLSNTNLTPRARKVRSIRSLYYAQAVPDRHGV